MAEKTETETKTKSNVIPFPGVKNVTRGPLEQPRPEVIQLLEHYLIEARRGNIQGIAFAIAHADRSVNYAWVQDIGHNLVAAVADLQYELGRDRSDFRRSLGKDDDPPDLNA